jgi:protein subunit release factor A
MKVNVEIRSAEGGDDAKLFCRDLIKAYRRLCDKLG